MENLYKWPCPPSHPCSKVSLSEAAPRSELLVPWLGGSKTELKQSNDSYFFCYKSMETGLGVSEGTRQIISTCTISAAILSWQCTGKLHFIKVWEALPEFADNWPPIYSLLPRLPLVLFMPINSNSPSGSRPVELCQRSLHFPSAKQHSLSW